MALFLDGLLAAIALLGHLALCVASFNRLHAVGMHRRPRRVLELLLVLGSFVAIVWYAWSWWSSGQGPLAAWHTPGGSPWTISYANACLIAAVAIVPCWLWPRLSYRVPKQLVQTTSRIIDVNALAGGIPLHGTQAKMFSWVPGNQVLKLEVTTKSLHLANLPRELEGLTITHLSDLHFTGEIGRPYYDHVVSEAEQLASDVVIISGDIIESTACESWIADTLGRLRAPLGVYYVLGNHDKRMPNVDHVRQLLANAGMIDLGGRTLRVDWKGAAVLLAGNERPWFPTVSDDHLRQAANSSDPAPFRLLVSHSPDQLAWARRHSFSLMLAGHNHGGQVCFPLLGPLIAPSLYGTRYAAGLYWSAPTLLHVSRGIAGEHPLRINCLPEITQLVLRGE